MKRELAERAQAELEPPTTKQRETLRHSTKGNRICRAELLFDLLVRRFSLFDDSQGLRRKLSRAAEVLDRPGRRIGSRAGADVPEASRDDQALAGRPKMALHF